MHRPTNYRKPALSKFVDEVAQASKSGTKAGAVTMSWEESVTILTLADEPELLIETYNDLVPIPAPVLKAALMRASWGDIQGYA